jgi:hypothetical protein
MTNEQKPIDEKKPEPKTPWWKKVRDQIGEAIGEAMDRR